MDPSQIAAAFGYMEERQFTFSETEYLDGNKTIHRGKEAINFATITYTGMEYNQQAIQALKHGADEAGLSPRIAGFQQRPIQCKELRKTLETMLGGDHIHVFLTPSTSQASASFMFSCVKKGDILVMEKGRTHGSIIIYAAIPAHYNKVPIEFVSLATDRPAGMAKLKTLGETAAKVGGTVWYCSDSFDSVFGTYLPGKVYKEVLATAPNVKLFVDDAHGISAFGKYGRGIFLSDNEMNERTILAGCLNKAFGGSGGFLAFGDVDMYQFVRRSAMPTHFQGSIPPPYIYADLALAKFHLTQEFADRQKTLQQHCSYVHKALKEAGLPNTSFEDVPLKFIHTGTLELACNITDKMLERGFYIMPMSYPGVARGHAGLRFTLSASHTKEQVEAFTSALLECCPKDLPPVTKSVHDPLYEVMLTPRGACSASCMNPPVTPRPSVQPQVSPRPSITAGVMC